jgi:hypothetical protein
MTILPALRWLCLVALLLPCSQAWSAGVVLIARDSESGAPVDAQLRLYPLDAVQAVTASLLLQRRGPVEAEIALLAGRATVAFKGPALALLSAPGYAELAAVVEPGTAGWTFWLRPLASRMPEAAGSDAGMQVWGTVRDADSLVPLEGVELRLEPAGLVTRSDAEGRYAFALAPAAESADAPLFHRLHAQLPGWPAFVDAAIPNAAGLVRRNIDLGAASGPPHRLQVAQAQQDVAEPESLLAPSGTGPDDPPLSIRVGFADAGCTQICCTANCTHTCVFDTETYVRRGITREWIGSWTQDSLRAGTVAYRSYGAWHAFNPVAGRPFDLCSSACCQVSGGSESDAGRAAARATAGLMLQRNGGVFRAEYSAENNCRLGTMSCSNSDLSCGNGFAGSPATNWPCLADAVGLDRDCFGHGRGMSQWGTQRWSLSPHFRRWPWIVNHYYNANGAGSGLRTATLTRALAILDAAPEPASVLPGEGFDIVLEALNRAGESHQAVLVGASIRRGSDPFLSDPPNDALIELQPGTGLATRRFEVPANAAPGTYALWVSLYLDIDGDGDISGNDLVQSLIQIPAALEVLGAEEPPALPLGLFDDGFEAALH